MKGMYKKQRSPKAPLIAIYDSGVGGLLVMREFLKRIPHASYMYYADSANMPYGNKTSDEILTWTQNILSWMMVDFKPDFLVSACNTSSSVLAVSEDQEYLKVLNSPLDILKDDCVVKSKNIIVACTHATAKSKIHEKIILANNPSSQVATIGFEKLAYLIENDASLLEIETEIFNALKEVDLSLQWDAIICGCTHYSVVRDVFLEFFKRNMPQMVLPQFIDPAVSMVEDIKSQIQRRSFDESQKNERAFYSNDVSSVNFDHKIRKFLDLETESLYHNPHKKI